MCYNLIRAIVLQAMQDYLITDEEIESAYSKHQYELIRAKKSAIRFFNDEDCWVWTYTNLNRVAILEKLEKNERRIKMQVSGKIVVYPNKTSTKEGKEKVTYNAHFSRKDENDKWETFPFSVVFLKTQNDGVLFTNALITLQVGRKYHIDLKDSFFSFSSYKNANGESVKRLTLFVKECEFIKDEEVVSING